MYVKFRNLYKMSGFYIFLGRPTHLLLNSYSSVHSEKDYYNYTFGKIINKTTDGILKYPCKSTKSV